jgi:hypothetical protein
MAMYKILNDSESYTSAQINEISRKFVESLARQISYFALEKRKDMTSERTLEIKQHNVSGEATSFIADCLRLSERIEDRKFKHIKKALFYLGSLTQFTDDIRDYKEDKKNHNANLLINLEKEDKVNAKNKFIDWYLRDEKFLIDEIKKGGLNIDDNLIKLIPWYPLFMK